MTSTEYANVVRAMIQHEDALRDQRLGWLFALNGFLFAALGLAWNRSDSKALVVVLSIVGVVVALSGAAAMRASAVAVRTLGALPAAQRRDLSDEPPVIALRSADLRQLGGVANYIPYLYPWRIVPWCLAAAWIAVIVVRLTVG
jgi:hypothetical protein